MDRTERIDPIRFLVMVDGREQTVEVPRRVVVETLDIDWSAVLTVWDQGFPARKAGMFDTDWAYLVRELEHAAIGIGETP